MTTRSIWLWRLPNLRARAAAGAVAQSVPPATATPAAPARLTNVRRVIPSCCGIEASSGRTGDRGERRSSSRDRPYDRRATGASVARVSVDGEQVHDEHERLVRLDHATRAARAVRHRRRDRQLTAAADLHALHSGVPARDHLALAELELE